MRQIFLDWTIIIKNSQKLPKTTILVISTAEAAPREPIIISSISSQLTIRKVAKIRKKKLTSKTAPPIDRPPIKIKQINYQPKIMGPWAFGPKGPPPGPNGPPSHHQQQVAGNNNHEYPRRSHLTRHFFSQFMEERRKKTYISCHRIYILWLYHHLTYKNCQLWWMPDLINGGTSEGGTYFKLPRLCPYKEPSRIADYILTTYLYNYTYYVYT